MWELRKGGVISADDNYHQNRTTAEKRVAATTSESCRIKDQSIYLKKSMFLYIVIT